MNNKFTRFIVFAFKELTIGIELFCRYSARRRRNKPQYFNPWETPVIGKYVSLQNTLLDCANKITIEDYVFFGHDVMLLTARHDYTKLLLERRKTVISKPIYIKKGAWICSRAVVLGGVTVGEHSVVGAGSIVTHDVPPYSVVGGNPARVIKHTKKSSNSSALSGKSFEL
jgi:acetyltransferase-like isoleucine patch superfamily enzyme